jgi:Secretion system C-terminal sorting domain
LVALVQATSLYAVSSYLVKLDNLLSIEWIKKFNSTYNPPNLISNNSSVFDVYQTPDNGFLCSGVVQSDSGSLFEQKLWAFRVDACGELVFSNCPLTSHTDAIAQSSLFELWPNPSIGKVFFHSAENTQTVNVLDMNGAVVATHSPKSMQFELDLSQLPVGLYIVRATAQNGDFSYQKLVISR